VSAADVALEAARIAADLLLALVPADEARALINEAEIRRANAIADAAAAAKFGRLADDEEPTNPGA
jgi:hypothetical protein